MTYKPAGWSTVTPRLFTSDVKGLVGFMRTVFGAEGELRSGAPSELRIGESVIMVSDGGGVREARGSFLYVYVESADDTYARAVGAGVMTIEAPLDTPYGDRRATVEDRWGNVWQIATHTDNL